MGAKRLNDPAGFAIAITPGTPLVEESRSVYIGGDGNMTCTMALDGSLVTFIGVVAGTTLPIQIKGVEVAGLTASNLVSLY